MKGEAETLFVGKLELLYNAISDTNTAAYNMAMSMSEQASEIYKNKMRNNLMEKGELKQWQIQRNMVGMYR